MNSSVRSLLAQFAARTLKLRFSESPARRIIGAVSRSAAESCSLSNVLKAPGRLFIPIIITQMTRLIITLLIAAAALAAGTPAHMAVAQTREPFPEGTVRLTLTDGTTVVGIIEREDDEELVIRTASGVVMTIPREQLESRETLAGQRFSRADPNQTRLLFAPTARALDSGTGYVSFYEIFFPFVAVSAGPQVTLAGGMSINPGSGRLFYAAPKVTVYQNPTMSFAVGALGVAGVGAGDGETAGLLFGVVTLGPSHGSITGGAAFGFVDGRFGKNPALMLGGEYQLSNNVKLLSENYLFVGEVEAGVLVSGGLRFFGDQLAADIGLLTLTGIIDHIGSFPFIPWLGFTYNFGR